MVQNKKFEQSFLNEYMAIKLHEFDVKERGRAEGFAKGEAKGKAEKATEDARAFLKLGVPVETVAQGTGLSVEYLKTLLQ